MSIAPAHRSWNFWQSTRRPRVFCDTTKADARIFWTISESELWLKFRTFGMWKLGWQYIPRIEMVSFEVQLLIDLIDGLIKKIIRGGDGCAGMMRTLRGFHFNVFEHRAIHDNHLHPTFFLMIVTQQSEFLKMTLWRMSLNDLKVRATFNPMMVTHESVKANTTLRRLKSAWTFSAHCPDYSRFWCTDSGLSSAISGYHPFSLIIWLVVWNIFYFSIIYGNNPSHWLIFFRGVETTNQSSMTILFS